MPPGPRFLLTLAVGAGLLLGACTAAERQPATTQPREDTRPAETATPTPEAERAPSQGAPVASFGTPCGSRQRLDRALELSVEAMLEFSMPGFAYGQKAGYYVSDGTPYHLVGAGYFRPDGGGPGFAAALLMNAENPDLMEPQRRTVFPLLVQHVLSVTAAATP